MADDQEYLDELTERRRKLVGVKSTQFSDQATTFDPEALDREIRRVEQVIRGRSRTRYAATSKGV